MSNSQLTTRAHGLAYPDEGRAIIDSQRCREFMDWYMSDKTSADDSQVWAAGVLIHESVHLEGEWNEAITECKTMERYTRVATDIMGVPHDEAVRMSKTYEKLHMNTPKEYHMDCDAYWAARSNAAKEAKGGENSKNDDGLNQ